MASTQSGFGLRPYNLVGGQHYSGGSIREIYLPSDVAAFYFGCVVYLNTASVITPIGSSPTAPKIPSTSADATAGVLGVCVGVRYVDPILKYSMHSQYLPANATTAGYTDIWIKVCDDPNQLYMIQADTAVGTKPNGARGAIGQNGALKTFTGTASTTLSNTVLDTGSNWGSLAATSTLAMRVVDVVTPNDTYPELIVKFNAGLHAYNNPLGIASS